MANKVIAIEIGNAITRLVQMDYQTKKPKVYRHATIQTPEGSYSDGYINSNSNSLAVAIQKAINDNNMTGTKNVIFTIASSKILTREVMIPPVKENMIEPTVKLNLSEYFPIDLSQYEVATLPLERITQEGDNFGKYRVLIVAADKEMVMAYETLAKSCGLILQQVDYVGNSIYQAFKNEGGGKCSMILKIEERQTSITIVDKQNLLLQRNVNYGIEEVIQEVVNQQAFGVKYYDEACKYVKSNKCVLDNLSDTASSVVGEGGDDGSIRKGGGIQINEARAAVTRTVSQLISAVSRVVDFYNSRFAVPIDGIYICGLGGTFTDLNVLFGNEMGIKTNMLKKMDEIQWAALGDNGDFPGYAATIGAAMGPIGLYSKSKIDKVKNKTNYKALGILVFLLCIVISIVLFVPKSLSLVALTSENKQLKQTEADYVEAEEIYNVYASTLTMYQQMYNGSMMIKNPNDNILKFFDELENKLPSDVRIEGLSSTDTTVAITMVVDTKETMAGVVQMFRGMDSIQSVSVTSLTEEAKDVTVFTDDDGVMTVYQGTDVDPEDVKEDEELIVLYTYDPETDEGEFDYNLTQVRCSIVCTYMLDSSTESN